MKEERKRKIKFRRNFLPTLFLIIFLWLAIFSIIYFVEPTTFGVIPIFFLIFFLANLFSSATIFANTRRGLIISISLTLFLILRFLGIGNILNAVLILALAVTAEVYFIKQM